MTNAFSELKGREICGLVSVPVQQTSQLVSNVYHHHLLAGAGQVGDLTLDGLGHTGVDGATESTVRGHTNNQVLGSLILRGLDVGLLVQGWGAEEKADSYQTITAEFHLILTGR